jgi:MarR family 2-MHQ and catechol resistance regulon transcriptional repressor
MDAEAIYFVARRLTAAARETISPVAQASTVSATERIILQDLMEAAPTSVQDIARRTRVAQSRVSAVVAKWRDRDAIRFRTDPNDGRRALLEPSPAFSAHVSAGANRPAEAVIDALEINLTRGDRRAILHALSLLHKELKAADRR